MKSHLLKFLLIVLVFHGSTEYCSEDREDSEECTTMTPQAEITVSPVEDDPLSLCGDWTQLGVKCYKVIELLTTKNDGKERCKQLDQSAYLVQIRSDSEQKRIYEMVKKYNSRRFPVVKDSKMESPSKTFSFWLGAHYSRRGSYNWDDKNINLDYTNWDEESPDTSGTNSLCVQMSLATGKWSDVKCGKKNLIVCEKSNELTMDNLYSALQNVYRILNEKSNTVPIGFIYTQFPNQSSPLDIWQNTQWTEITDQYSGLFFRAEGKASKPFGQIQQQNYPRISQIMTELRKVYEYEKILTEDFVPVNETIREGQWNHISDDQSNQGDYDVVMTGLSFYQSDGENVPVNAAIKIWKRIA